MKYVPGLKMMVNSGLEKIILEFFHVIFFCFFTFVSLFELESVDFCEFSHLTDFSLGTKISSENDENSIIFNVYSRMRYLHFPKRDVDSFEFSHLTKFSLGTEIFFDIDFEIENKFLNIVMTKSFQFGLDKIADAFQKRAEELFGNSKN